MKSTIAIKFQLSNFLQKIGYLNIKFRRMSQNSCLVLMYHRVIQPEAANIPLQAGMFVTPNTLKTHLEFLSHYFKMIRLEELMDYIAGNKVYPINQPLCAITFDDGWIDFYEHAYPLLATRQTPATVFLPTNLTGSDRWFWTDRIAYFLDRSKNRNANSHNPLTQQILGMEGSTEEVIENAICLLKRHKLADIENAITNLEAALGNVSVPNTRLFINWHEAREMYNSGFVSFGSHTANHPILTTLDEEEISTELFKSKEKLTLERVVAPQFIPFCYPNGNFNPYLAKLVEEAGYSLAVTTDFGWNRPNSSLFSLKRIGIHQDITSTPAMFGCRIAGLI